MDNKMNTFDQGLNYLNQIPKDDAFFSRTKLEALPWLLFFMKSLGKFLNGKSKAKEIIAFAGKKLRQSPWRILVSVGAIAFLSGVVSRKILAGKQKI